MGKEIEGKGGLEIGEGVMAEKEEEEEKNVKDKKCWRIRNGRSVVKRGDR